MTELKVELKINKKELTKYLKDELEDNSEYDELYKREILITMFCLRGSCTDKKELNEMFQRILKKCKK